MAEPADSPDWPDCPPSVGALATTRRRRREHRRPIDDGAGGGGLNLGLHVGDDAAPWREPRAAAALLPSAPVWISQVHGARGRCGAGGTVGAPEADASIASQAGVVCAVLTADCLPVLLCDLRGQGGRRRARRLARAGGGVLGGPWRDARARRAADHGLAGTGDRPAAVRGGRGRARRVRAGDCRAHSADFAPRERNGKYLADIYAWRARRWPRCGVDSVAGGECIRCATAFIRTAATASPGAWRL
jgi:copper oxidase (laccase) domain-containing protein